MATTERKEHPAIQTMRDAIYELLFASDIISVGHGHRHDVINQLRRRIDELKAPESESEPSAPDLEIASRHALQTLRYIARTVPEHSGYGVTHQHIRELEAALAAIDRED